VVRPRKSAIRRRRTRGRRRRIHMYLVEIHIPRVERRVGSPMWIGNSENLSSRLFNVGGMLHFVRRRGKCPNHFSCRADYLKVWSKVLVLWGCFVSEKLLLSRG
jgi:hypothetical protein